MLSMVAKSYFNESAFRGGVFFGGGALGGLF